MEPRGARFRHEALLYRNAADFVRHAARFVRAGLAAGDPILVAVPQPRARLLRAELGADAAGVEFLPQARIAGNPARLIPAWRDWVERAGRGGGVRPRVVSELIRAGGGPAEQAACLAHEHVANAAFAIGPAWTLLCLYDASLPGAVIEGVRRSHPVVSGAVNHDYQAVGAFDPLGASAVFEAPLPELGPPLFEVSFGLHDLPGLRAELRAHADALGLGDGELSDFVLVADELACNSVIHGGGDGRLLAWALGGYAVCEVRDKGLIGDPLVGRRRPDLRGPGPGAGLWSANQLCDLLLIRSVPAEGTRVRAYLSVG